MKSWGKTGDGDEADELKVEAPKAAEGEADDKDAPDEAKADAPKELPDEPQMPGGWGAARKKPKMWNEDRRTDDPDKRTVLAPLDAGIGDGKSFSFLFGLKVHSQLDRNLFGQAREHIDDDVELLRKVGYTVVIDEEATHAEFLATVAGTGEGVDGLVPTGMFWLAHGHESGAVETSDGGQVLPSDLDPASVHPGLRVVIFAACYTGSCSRTWRRQLGGHPLVVGWGRPVTIGRAVDFLTPNDETETDLDDLIRRYLLDDKPVPEEVAVRHSPTTSAAAAGYAGDLAKRLEAVVQILGAKQKERDDCVELDLPLGDRRWHRAKVFLIDANEPFCEGEPLLGAESDVGELSAVVDPPMLLAGVPHNRYARAVLVEGETEMPRIVTQGFLPYAKVKDSDLAALIFQVCAYGDLLEKRIFGGDSS